LAQLSQQQARMLAEDWGCSFSSCHGEPDFLGSQNRVTKGFHWLGLERLVRLGLQPLGDWQRRGGAAASKAAVRPRLVDGMKRRAA